MLQYRSVGPGLQLQRMTTREPSDDMIEVAVASMQLVVAREQREEALAGERADEAAPQIADGPLPA